MFRKLNGLERGDRGVPVWVVSARFPLPLSRNRESLHCANRPNALQGDLLRPPGNELCPLHEPPLMEVYNQSQYPTPPAAVWSTGDAIRKSRQGGYAFCGRATVTTSRPRA